MDTINFFVRETDLPLQDNSQSYGVINSLEYRVTSLFSGGNNPMAYAVTDGEIFIIQQANNPNRVNLFLKPTFLPMGLLSIKYFIYRGLLKADFLNANNSYNGIKLPASDDSYFIKQLRKAKNGKIALNLYPSLSDNDFIDDLFKDTTNQFALVKQGDSIGRFDSQLNYGFEIMLDENLFNPTLATARKLTNTIIVSSQIAEKETSRREILNYIDPAAFYGLFIHNNFSVETNNNATPKFVKKDEIYNKLVAKFATKNTVYIDIRDVYDNPIDWFVDSPQTIKITMDDSSALDSIETIYRDIDEYPIKTLTTGFSSSKTNKYEQKYFTLKISLSTLNNSSPLLTLQSGYWERFASDTEDNMVFSICTDNNGWTDDKEFTIFCINDASIEVPVATYLRLILSEYSDLVTIQNQIPDTEIYNPIIKKGLFAFNV
ncbi:MAG: hypothetical protein LBK03_04300 [Bacteroidales bacterium]|jgi:hypothetical protein|nr:hypothetical protein [Bacteroidales bacterium]